MNDYFCRKYLFMYHRELSEQAIISGFRKGDANIIREYFYGYCQAGYYIFDQRYQLREKENLDFMSLAHQYAIYLMEHDWKPLEDHSPNVSLKTWLINGFRYVVLDALKWYKKEYGSITFEDYLRSFDVTSDLRLQFNRMVEDVCDHAPLDRQERLLIDMLLLRGFKGKEIADQMGMTPSAISQKYKKLKEEIIIPYFKKNFDMDLTSGQFSVARLRWEKLRCLHLQCQALWQTCIDKGRARIWTLSEKILWRRERHQSLLHRWSRTRSLCSAAISKVCMEAGLPISPTASSEPSWERA